MVEVSMRNLDEFTITDEALRRIAATPDTRIKEIMTSLIRHLHDFARDVRLTEPEWLAGILFLTRTGHLCSDVRQEFILLSDTLGLSQLVVAQSHSSPENVSEQTVFGPFHVEGAPTRPSHRSDLAQGAPGAPLYVTAQVAAGGHPFAAATVHTGHADPDGFYVVQAAHLSDEHASLPTPL